MAFGLTESGFELKRLADIKTELENTLRANLGSSINLLPESVFGQIVAIMSERESLVWELMEDVYNSAYPDTATGVSLDRAAQLTGITRLAAQKSQAIAVRLFGTSGTLVPTGTVFSVNGNPEARFVSNNDVTLVAGVDEVQDIDFSAVPASGNWRLNWRGTDTSTLAFNANAAAVQAALQALPFGSGITVAGNYTTGFTVTFAGAAGKQEQELILVDSNTLADGGSVPVDITIVETTAGVNQAVVDCLCEDFGPIQALAGTLTVIETPVSGLDSVINMTDALLGRNVETDTELKLRREQTLQVAGKATVDAIRSALLNLSGVENVIVFENDTELTDIDGRPPKSYECVINGGDDQEIADKIWDTKPAGIRTFGTESETVTDSQGLTHIVKFSRPTQLLIYLEVDLTTDSNFPVNGLAQAEQALVTVGNSFGIGKNVVVYPTLISALNSIPGIVDVAIRIGTSPSPTLDDNITVDVNEVAVFDTSRIDVQDV